MQLRLPYPDLMEGGTDEDDVSHVAHPRRLDRNWCGTERDPAPYRWRSPEEGVDCVVCAQLWQEHGYYGWVSGVGA